MYIMGIYSTGNARINSSRMLSIRSRHALVTNAMAPSTLPKASARARWPITFKGAVIDPAVTILVV